MAALARFTGVPNAALLCVQVAALLAAYTLAMFAFYSLVPLVLRWSGAAILNLSLLSSNLWAALARALILGQLGSGKSLLWPHLASYVRVQSSSLCLYWE